MTAAAPAGGLGLAFCLVLAVSQRPASIATGLALLAARFVLRLAVRRAGRADHRSPGC